MSAGRSSAQKNRQGNLHQNTQQNSYDVAVKFKRQIEAISQKKQPSKPEKKSW